MNQFLGATFYDTAAAATAIDDLLTCGWSRGEVSVMMSRRTRTRFQASGTLGAIVARGGIGAPTTVIAPLFVAGPAAMLLAGSDEPARRSIAGSIAALGLPFAEAELVAAHIEAGAVAIGLRVREAELRRAARAFDVNGAVHIAGA